LDSPYKLRIGASPLTGFRARVGLSIIYLRRLGELSMRALSLAEALKIIEGTFAAAKVHNCHALAAIVLDTGGRIKAFQKQDGASLMRFEIAYGTSSSNPIMEDAMGRRRGYCIHRR
jgi:hypothetical protein